MFNHLGHHFVYPTNTQQANHITSFCELLAQISCRIVQWKRPVNNVTIIL